MEKSADDEPKNGQVRYETIYFNEQRRIVYDPAKATIALVMKFDANGNYLGSEFCEPAGP